jgi:hypothetical protein
MNKKSNIGIIYKTTSISEQKSYVGKRHKSPETFLRQNYYGSGVIIGSKVKVHGKQDFNRYILEVVDISTPEGVKLLWEREIYWIAKLNTIWPNGYNIAKGGGGGAGTSAGGKKCNQTKRDRGIQVGWTSEQMHKYIANRRAKGLKVGGFTSKMMEKVWIKRRINGHDKRTPEVIMKTVESRAFNLLNSQLYGKPMKMITSLELDIKKELPPQTNVKL